MEKKKITLIVLIAFIVLAMLYALFQIKWVKLFSPGKLAVAHEEFDQRGECSACHTKGMQLDNGKCLECHEEIEGETLKEYGLHGHASKECSKCHSEHHGRDYSLSYLDPETFDHTTTGWTLDRVHSLLRCEACHSRDSYLLDMHECVYCHNDVHRGQLGKECHKCHHAETFKIDAYQHKGGKNAPSGVHLQLDCDECHTVEAEGYPSDREKPIKYIGIDFTCKNCHEDVHDGEYGNDCSECHNQETFETD